MVHGTILTIIIVIMIMIVIIVTVIVGTGNGAFVFGIKGAFPGVVGFFQSNQMGI